MIRLSKKALDLFIHVMKIYKNRFPFTTNEFLFLRVRGTLISFLQDSFFPFELVEKMGLVVKEVDL